MSAKCLRLLSLTLLLCGACRMPGQHAGHGTIAIRPIGDFPAAMADTIAVSIQKLYEDKVFLLPRIQMPSEFYNADKGPRYNASAILQMLKEDLPDSANRVIALTTLDIFTSKKDKNGKIKQPESTYANWGIFGLGQCPGKACVVSSYRLRRDKEELLKSRLIKVSLHEVGHTFGLPHCPDKKCLMTDAVEKLSTVDAATDKLCENCRKKAGLKD